MISLLYIVVFFLGDGSTTDDLCRTSSSEFWTSIILFVAQFVSGIGGTLCYSIGISYFDDNLERSSVPIMLSKCTEVGI